MTRSHQQRRERYLNAIRSLKPGVTEIIIHCGFDNQELRAITSSAPRRDGDRRVFLEREVADLIKEQDIEVITWREFRQLAQNRELN